MYALLFFCRRFIVLAFVSVLRKVCVTNVWGYTEIFPNGLKTPRVQAVFSFLSVRSLSGILTRQSGKWKTVKASMEINKKLRLCTYWPSWRAGWENIWLEDLTMTESLIFSHPARPNLVNTYFIVWPIWRQNWSKCSKRHLVNTKQRKAKSTDRF